MSVEQDAILYFTLVEVLLSKVTFREKVRKRTHISSTHSRKINLKHRVLVCTFSRELFIFNGKTLQRGIENGIRGLFLLCTIDRISSILLEREELFAVNL